MPFLFYFLYKYINILLFLSTPLAHIRDQQSSQGIENKESKLVSCITLSARRIADLFGTIMVSGAHCLMYLSFIRKGYLTNPGQLTRKLSNFFIFK